MKGKYWHAFFLVIVYKYISLKHNWEAKKQV